MEDFNKIQGERDKIESHISTLLQKGKNFISDFHELPEDIAAKEVYEEGWQDYIEEESKIAIERIQELNQIVKTIHEAAAEIEELTENMKSDLEDDRELLKQVVIGIEREGMEFEIETGPTPGAAD